MEDNVGLQRPPDSAAPKSSPLPTWAALAALAVASCGTPTATEAHHAAPRRAESPVSWCQAVTRATAGLERDGFHCLEVPNFLLTGFYGPEKNPERSDFENACFAGDESAASRLRLSVRPAANLSFRLRSRSKLSAGGSLDLRFLGPWAPKIGAKSAKTTTVEVDVTLSDAEIRVLSSVAEILGQQYEDQVDGSPLRSSLESCIATLCDATRPDERIVYTAKVLAAVPVIRLRSETGERLDVELATGVTGFELARDASHQDEFVLRSRDKLNVAALLEEARPAFERAETCRRVAAARARRQVTSELRALSLATLGGRALGEVPAQVQALRTVVESAGYSEAERAALLGSLEVVEGCARQLSLPKPTAALCATRSLAESVLAGPADSGRVLGLSSEALTPLHKKLTEMANGSGLPCADPLWYRDIDRDGYGDKKASVRAAAQPPGYVANALDCYDQNPEAYPGQQRFFMQHRGDGSFDYDCDGKGTKRDDVQSEGCREVTTLGIPTKCWADVGWRSGVPECGAQGRWLAECETSTLSCSPTVEPRRVQECR